MLSASDQELRDDLVKRLVTQQLLGPTQRISEHHDPTKLPMRYLHGNVATLYLMYVAQCQVQKEKPACRTVFYQVYKHWWACLRFHRKSNHALCHVCAQLRSKIHAAKASWYLLLVLVPSLDPTHPSSKKKRNHLHSWGHYICHIRAEDFQLHANLCDELLAHFSHQFREREVYWAARAQSRLRQEVVTLICDSFDKSKVSIPKYPYGRIPKRVIYEEIKRILVEHSCFFQFQHFANQMLD